MKEYLMMVLGVCMVAGVVRVISPEGGMKKHIEMLCSLCLAAAVALPLVGAFLNIDGDGIRSVVDEIFDGYETQELESIYNDYVARKNTDAVESALEQELKGALDCEDIRVVVDIEMEETCEIRQVSVILGLGAMSADPDIIKNTVFERLCVECEIIYDKMTKK